MNLNGYQELARVRNFAAIAITTTILIAQAFAHLEIHADIPEPMKEQQEKDKKEREARDAYDRYCDDPDNASDRDTSEATSYVRDYGS